MEKTTEISFPYQVTKFIDRNLKVLLNIENIKYDIPIDYLFSMAARENPKRKFLFVSKVLGKHSPINPMVLRITGAILARTWLLDNDGNYDSNIEILAKALKKLQGNDKTIDYNKVKVLEILNSKIFLKEKTLFIGFAETATGIAQAVFSCFDNAAYIHTTREKIPELTPNFTFKEEHSHAVNHVLYSRNKAFLSGYDRIVLIDDELTTGNTAINLIKNLPGTSFGIITILDWRDEEALIRFNSLKNVDIKVSSLLKGTIDLIKEDSSIAADMPIKIEHNFSTAYKNITVSSYYNLINGYLPLTGRFGISSQDIKSLDEEIEIAAKLLRKEQIPGNCLCLGTEEFIYIPCMISAKLYKDLKAMDVSNFFIDTIANEFEAAEGFTGGISKDSLREDIIKPYKGLYDIEIIKTTFNINDINLVKPGVGETTRVLLRRIPWKILVNNPENPNLKHIIRLAKERNVPVETYKNMSYSCCGIIKPKEFGDI